MQRASTAARAPRKDAGLEVLAPNILSLSLGPDFAATSDTPRIPASPHPRVTWSNLLRRTSDVDVKTCTKCGGRLEPRALADDGGGLIGLLTRTAPARIGRASGQGESREKT